MAKKKRDRRWWGRVVGRYLLEKEHITMRAFSEREGLVYGTFCWWVHHLRQSKDESEKAVVPALVPLQVVGSAGVREIAGRSESWLEAELADGLLVRFSDGVCVRYVASLMHALRRGSSC